MGPLPPLIPPRSWDFLEDTSPLGQVSLAMPLQMAQAATSPPPAPRRRRQPCADSLNHCCQQQLLGTFKASPVPPLGVGSAAPSQTAAGAAQGTLSWGLPEPLTHTPCPRCGCQRPCCCSAKSLAPPSHPVTPTHIHVSRSRAPAS